MNNRKYYWNGTKSELIELCYALYANKLIEGENLHMLNFKETCSLVFDLLGEKLPHNPYDSVYQMRLRKRKMAGSILYKSFKKCFDC